MTLGERGECRQRDPLGGRLGQRDPDLNEEARVEVGEQTDVDILEAGMAGLGDLLGREVAGGAARMNRLGVWFRQLRGWWSFH